MISPNYQLVSLLSPSLQTSAVTLPERNRYFRCSAPHEGLLGWLRISARRIRTNLTTGDAHGRRHDAVKTSRQLWGSHPRRILQQRLLCTTAKDHRHSFGWTAFEQSRNLLVLMLARPKNSWWGTTRAASGLHQREIDWRSRVGNDMTSGGCKNDLITGRIIPRPIVASNFSSPQFGFQQPCLVGIYVAIDFETTIINDTEHIGLFRS